MRIPLGGNSCGGGKVHLKRGAPAWFGEYVHESVMLLHNPVYNRQSQPRSLPRVLGREEGLEDVVQGCCVHPNSGVGNLKYHVITRPSMRVATAEILANLDILGSNEQMAPPG